MRRSRFAIFGTAALLSICCAFLFFCPNSKAWQTSRNATALPNVQNGNTPPVSTGLPDMNKRTEEDSVRVRMEESAAKARNSDRFKRIQADTDRLLKLSTELKADVEKSSKNELSLDVIRKAEEIEKLARGVKERMKG